MAARRPFWKWRRWKSVGFYLWPPSTCIWNLKLKFQSKLDLCSGNHVVYRQTDGRTDRRTDKVNPIYTPSNFVGRGYNHNIEIPVWGYPICILWGGPGRFGAQSVELGLDVVDQFYRANLCLHWVQLVFALFQETFCLWMGVQVPRASYFINFQKNHLNGTTKLYKEIHAGVFFSHPLKFCAEWLMGTLTWPLSDHSSIHSRW